MLYLSIGCKPKTDSTSYGVKATGKRSCENWTIDTKRLGLCWNDADRLMIYRSVRKVAVPIFKKIFHRYDNDLLQNSHAKKIAKNMRIMFTNMLAGDVNPLAFFSMVKDFETAKNLKWANSKNRKGKVYTTKNCTSKECYGLFQVDVKLEKDWSPKICEDLGIYDLEGGPDFCASLFWWFEAEGGNKCKKITSGSKNPCKTPETNWTLDMVNNGRKAYVQAIQRGWGQDAWKEMYLKHVRVAIQEEMKLLGKTPSGEKQWRDQYAPKVLKLMPMWLGMTSETEKESETSTNSDGDPVESVLSPDDFFWGRKKSRESSKGLQ